MRDEPGSFRTRIPIDLASEPDFALGAMRVQPASRRIVAGLREESVEPRVMQVLIALSEAAGTVVSRDSLIDRCWGGRIVGEDAINRCIAKLRRLAEISEPPAFSIETISKVGYRLRCDRIDAPANPPAEPAEPAAPEGAATSPAPVRPAPRRRLWLACGAIAIALFAGAAAEVATSRRHLRWSVQSSRMLLTAPGGITTPQISPDGSKLAYTVGARDGHGRIFVKPLAGGTPWAVSLPSENAESAAWAADNTQLAYVVMDPNGAPCRIMVAKMQGGVPVAVGRCRRAPITQIAWQPATPYLFFRDGQLPPFSNALFRLDIRTGRTNQVTTPATSEEDFEVRVSPNGAWLAYVRSQGFAGRVLRLRNLASGEERVLDGDPDLYVIDWAKDSQTLIASVLGQKGDEIRVYPMEGSPGYRIYANAASIGDMSVGPNGMLALEIDERRSDLARASVAPRVSVDVIDPANGMTDWPAFAPDGTLAFVSDRSGELALWTRKPGGQPVPLVIAGLKDIERPVWSPDGSRIAFFEVWKGDITVHVVTAQGREVVSFGVPSIGFGMPNWTRDGEHLVTFDKRILQAVRIDLRNPAIREPIEEKLQDGITYRRGAIYSTGGFEPGIWQLNGGPRLITSHYPTGRGAQLAFVGDDVLLPESRNAGDLRVLAQPLRGGPERVAYYAPAAEALTPFAVDPITGDVVYVSEVEVDSHIELLGIGKE